MLIVNEVGISREKQRPAFSMLSHEFVDDGEDVVSHGLDQGLHLYVREETVGGQHSCQAVLGIIAIRSDDDRCLCGRKRTERKEALQRWDDGLGVL